MRSDGLFDAIFTSSEVAETVDDRAWLQALLDVEAALAAAHARNGRIPTAAARAIAQQCNADRFDIAELGRAASAGGNPVIPLVRALRAAVPPDASGVVHLGATSQDILDSAAMLIARRALGPILDDLAAGAAACAGLALAHRETLQVGRTLLQQAVPITFGLKAAGWLVGLDATHARLAVVRDRLPVQLGGAAGTLAPLGTAGVGVVADLADELGLAEPVLPWHTLRVPVAELAGALGATAGVLGKIAGDVKLLAQTEVGEVAERQEAGRGGSSTMPHKRNPVASVAATACAVRVPGLVATLLAAMTQEHERAAGAWQAEWETLSQLLRLVGGAAGWMCDALEGLEVDAGRMWDNLALSGGVVLAERVSAVLGDSIGEAAAREEITAAAARAADEGRSLRAVLAETPVVREHLSAEQLDAALVPGDYLGSTQAFIDRALAAHNRLM